VGEEQSFRQACHCTFTRDTFDHETPRQLVSGDLTALIERVTHSVMDKITLSQGGIPTFFDNLILGTCSIAQNLITRHCGPNCSGLETDVAEIQNILREYMERDHGQRFTEVKTRIAESRRRSRRPWELQSAQMAPSQGVYECLHWRGMALFKTAFDFALYPMMLWEIKPRSILELGSGTGASAVWLSDVLSTFGVPGRVVSVDLIKPPIDCPGVQFISGDCNNIETVLPMDLLKGLPHPWVVIEDAHVNTGGVLRHFRPLLRPGDYVIVEDSENKISTLNQFANEVGSEFMVDTRYTDFFGRNATCSKDSIFVKVQ